MSALNRRQRRQSIHQPTNALNREQPRPVEAQAKRGIVRRTIDAVKGMLGVGK